VVEVEVLAAIRALEFSVDIRIDSMVLEREIRRLLLIP